VTSPRARRWSPVWRQGGPCHPDDLFESGRPAGAAESRPLEHVTPTARAGSGAAERPQPCQYLSVGAPRRARTERAALVHLGEGDQELGDLVRVAEDGGGTGRELRGRRSARSAAPGRRPWLSTVTQYRQALPLSDLARAALDRASPSKQGVIFGEHDYREVLRSAALRAGLDPDVAERVTVHCFRHSRITFWAETAGDNLAGVQYLAGHKKSSTTEKYIKTSLRAAEQVLARNSGYERDTASQTQFPTASGPSQKTQSFQGVRGGGLEPPWQLTASTSRLEPARKQ